MRLATFLVSLVLSSIPSQAAAINTTVTLDQGTFHGAYDPTYNITYYRSIRFAPSTAGPNRFRAPQPLPPYNGTYNTDQTFDMCPQRGINGSEDCLFLGLYSRPWQPSQPLRPVVVVLYGGGYIRGSASFSIPPSGYPVLNVSQENDFVVVYPNYRVNAFGFLPGKEIGRDARTDTNVGLRDQDAALRWVGTYIREFGGNPNDVTVWGQSAGGGGVIAQSIKYAGSRKGGRHGGMTIKRALASSPFWSKTYRYDSEESEAVFKRFVELSGCANATDAIGCLKSADLQSLREVAEVIKDDHLYTTSSFTWGPVIDDDFITTPLSELVGPGDILPDVAWGMYNTHEGENFIPPGLANTTGAQYNASTGSFDAWLKGYLPLFSPEDIQSVKVMYPPAGKAEHLEWNTTYGRAGVVFRDSVLACPALWLAQAAEKKGTGKGYVGEYTISPAKHASDTVYWNQVNVLQTEQPLIYDGYAGAFASLFQTGDPNANKVTSESSPGVPGLRSEMEFVVESNGFANVNARKLEERCAFWRSVAKKIPL